MIRQVVRKSYRTIMVVWLAGCLSLSANVALAAHQLTEEGSGVVNFHPIGGTSPVTSAELEVSQEQGQTKIRMNPDTGVFENVRDHDVWFLDEEGDRRVRVGRLDEISDEGVSTSIDNFEDFDSAVIARPLPDGDEPDGDEDIAFKADLPHE